MTDSLRAGARGSSTLGTGGMATKLVAADYLLQHGRQMVLINGENPATILEVLAGEPVGTLFKGE